MTTTIRDHDGHEWVLQPDEVAEEWDVEEIWTSEAYPRARIDRWDRGDGWRWIILVDGDEWTHCGAIVPLADAVDLLPTDVRPWRRA